jgi:uncharacterized membrane protein YfcA
MTAPRRSQIIAIGLPALLAWIMWVALMMHGNHWALFTSNADGGVPNWYMSVTMAVGSFIAGATSEGGGAVAFPVMTLFFKVAPPVARDFSLMIQTVGMNAAAFAIFYMAVRVEKHALVWSTLGGALGVVLGMEMLARHPINPAFAKMLFVSCWLAFAFGLFWINRYHEREVHLSITNFLPRHAFLLFGTGIIGGSITAITGSGLDIATFALLVLRLRISERVATPTSVVLMAFNASIAFGYKAWFMDSGMEPTAWHYWYVCVPIVVVGAPFGAWFIKNKSRLYISGILYTSIGIQFVSAIVILKVYQKSHLAGFSVAIIAAGVAFFWFLARGGSKRLEWLTETGKEAELEG